MSSQIKPQKNLINKGKISKQEAIYLLEKTINQLNDVVNQINNDSVKKLPNKIILNELIESSNNVLSFLDLFPSKNVPKVDSKSFNFDSIKTFFKKSISSISSFTKPIILIIIILLIVFLVVLFNFIGKNNQQELPEKISLESEKITENQPINDIQIPQINENNFNNKLTEEITENDTEVEKIKKEIQLQKERENQLTIPLESIKSEDSNLTETIPSTDVTETIPSSEEELTPEQNLIMAIQNQVAEITKKYADGLILGIKANLSTGYLTITLDNSWYEITESKQNKLTQEILEKARKLDFYKLNLIDIKDNLIARNPVVGKEMIIVRR